MIHKRRKGFSLDINTCIIKMTKPYMEIITESGSVGKQTLPIFNSNITARICSPNWSEVKHVHLLYDRRVDRVGRTHSVSLLCRIETQTGRFGKTLAG